MALANERNAGESASSNSDAAAQEAIRESTSTSDGTPADLLDARFRAGDGDVLLGVRTPQHRDVDPFGQDDRRRAAASNFTKDRWTSSLHGGQGVIENEARTVSPPCRVTFMRAGSTIWVPTREIECDPANKRAISGVFPCGTPSISTGWEPPCSTTSTNPYWVFSRISGAVLEEADSGACFVGAAEREDELPFGTAPTRGVVADSRGRTSISFFMDGTGLGTARCRVDAVCLWAVVFLGLICSGVIRAMTAGVSGAGHGGNRILATTGTNAGT